MRLTKGAAQAATEAAGLIKENSISARTSRLLVPILAVTTTCNFQMPGLWRT